MDAVFDRRRVVVTGLGVVSSLGTTLDRFWGRLVAGECGIVPVTAFDVSRYACRIAAQIDDLDVGPAFPSPKDVRRTDRYAQFGVLAGHSALQDSGVDLAQLDPDRFGVFLGSGIGGLQTIERQHEILLAKGPGRVSPFLIPMQILNMASGLLSMYHGLRGPNMATCSACATSGHSIGEAWRTILMNDADLMLAGGAEAAITPIGIGGFSAMKALSTRNEEPGKASCPFDRERDGFVMGEGAAVLLLEEREHAKARGAEIYCEIRGYGNTADAHHMTSPDPQGAGAVKCMAKALQSAKLNPKDVGYINAHGTSTPQGDIAETAAIKQVFGDRARSLPVSSTKGATGHMLGAAGSIELAICALALKSGVLPPTINYEHPDPECDLDYVPNEAREQRVDAMLSNSFGFGGHNVSLLVTRPD